MSEKRKTIVLTVEMKDSCIILHDLIVKDRHTPGQGYLYKGIPNHKGIVDYKNPFEKSTRHISCLSSTTTFSRKTTTAKWICLPTQLSSSEPSSFVGLDSISKIVRILIPFAMATPAPTFFDAAASLVAASILMGDFRLPANTTTWINCTLVASDSYQNQLSRLQSGPPRKLIEMDIELTGYPPGVLKKWLKGVHRPYRWVRSTERESQSLLMLEENYSLMSLSVLSIGVDQMSFNISDRPPKCLQDLSPNEVMLALRNAFFADFKVDEDLSKQSPLNSIGETEDICNMHVVDEGGYAVFRYQCCHKLEDGSIVCKDVKKNEWIKILLILIVILKLLLGLYSPMFLPESSYRLKYVPSQYVYHLPNETEIPLNIVVTEEPHAYGDDLQDKTLRLSQLYKMEHFQTLVSSNWWQHDTVYEVKVKDVRLSVKGRDLLSRTKVPVGVFKIIYNNLILCRIRNLEAIKFCCDSSILGRFTPTGVKMMKWSMCVRLFAGFCKLVIVASPWFIRLMVYGLYEYDMLRERLETAERVDLPIGYTGSLVVYFTPVHGVFIVIYSIIVADSLIYGVIANTFKEKLKVVLRRCLRDMRERSRVAVCTWATKLMVLPFSIFGLLAFIIFPVYLAIILIVMVPVGAFYIFPTINITIRLLIHFFIFMCPESVESKLEKLSSKLSGLKKRLLISEVTAKEQFVEKMSQSTRSLVFQLFIISLCLLTFWSLTLLLMEIVSFFVEVLCYTFMGIVVNAGVTLQYCTVLGLVFWHGKSSSDRMRAVYLDYQQRTYDQILAIKKDDIDDVAKLEACDQQNTAFRVVGDKSSMAPSLDTPHLRVKGNTLQWVTPGILAFLNSRDQVHTPEKFFFNTIDSRRSGFPGPIYHNVLKALWDFAKIVLFLFFVLIIVLAFGDAYQISTTNQLLATVVGGVVPFFFSHFFQSNADLSNNRNTVQFITEFHTAINRFVQAWPVFDIIPSSVKEAEISDYEEEANYRDIRSSNPRVEADDITNTTDNGHVNDVTAGESSKNLADHLNAVTAQECFPDRVDHVTAQESSQNLVDEYYNFNNARIDLIVDVSTFKGKSSAFRRKTKMDIGSVSMLEFRNEKKNRKQIDARRAHHQENLV